VLQCVAACVAVCCSVRCTVLQRVLQHVLQGYQLTAREKVADISVQLRRAEIRLKRALQCVAACVAGVLTHCAGKGGRYVGGVDEKQKYD